MVLTPPLAPPKLSVRYSSVFPNLRNEGNGPGLLESKTNHLQKIGRPHKGDIILGSEKFQKVTDVQNRNSFQSLQSRQNYKISDPEKGDTLSNNLKDRRIYSLLKNELRKDKDTVPIKNIKFVESFLPSKALALKSSVHLNLEVTPSRFLQQKERISPSALVGTLQRRKKPIPPVRTVSLHPIQSKFPCRVIHNDPTIKGNISPQKLILTSNGSREQPPSKIRENSSKSTREFSTSKPLRHACRSEKWNDCDNGHLLPSEGPLKVRGERGETKKEDGSPFQANEKISSTLKGLSSPQEESVTLTVTDTIRRRIPSSGQSSSLANGREKLVNSKQDENTAKSDDINRSATNDGKGKGGIKGTNEISGYSEKNLSAINKSYQKQNSSRNSEQSLLRQNHVIAEPKEVVYKRSNRDKLSTSARISAALVPPPDEIAATMGNKHNKSENGENQSCSVKRKSSPRFRFLQKSKPQVEPQNAKNLIPVSSQPQNNRRSHLFAKYCFEEKKNGLKFGDRKHAGRPSSHFISENNCPENQEVSTVNFQAGTNEKKDRKNIIQLRECVSDCKEEKSNLPSFENNKYERIGTCESGSAKLDSTREQKSCGSKRENNRPVKKYSFRKQTIQTLFEGRPTQSNCAKNSQVNKSASLRSTNKSKSTSPEMKTYKKCPAIKKGTAKKTVKTGLMGYRTCSPCLGSATSSISSTSMSSPSSSLSPTSPESSSMHILPSSSSSITGNSFSSTDRISHSNFSVLRFENEFHVKNDPPDEAANSSASTSQNSESSKNNNRPSSTLSGCSPYISGKSDKQLLTKDGDNSQNSSSLESINLILFPLNESSQSLKTSSRNDGRQTVLNSPTKSYEKTSPHCEAEVFKWEEKKDGRKKKNDSSTGNLAENSVAEIKNKNYVKSDELSRNNFGNKNDIQIRLVERPDSQENEYVEITFFSEENNKFVMNETDSRNENLMTANKERMFGESRSIIVGPKENDEEEVGCNRVTDETSESFNYEINYFNDNLNSVEKKKKKLALEGILKNIGETNLSDISAPSDESAEKLQRSQPLQNLSWDQGAAASGSSAFDIKSILPKNPNSSRLGKEIEDLNPPQSQRTKYAPKSLKIYTDWANHYLEKNRSKRHISDLQSDVTDGVILGDVIEAVTGQKVPDLNKKPKNSSQMLDNVSAALNFLGGLGVELEGLTAKDIRDGNLKSILSLFFALSRFKQQQKQAQQERRELEKLREKKQESEMAANLASRLGSPYKSQNGCGSAIPTPALGGRKHSTDHHSRGNSRSATPSSGSLSGSQLKGIPSTSSSRSASPSNGSASFIPTPRGGHNAARSSTHSDKLRTNGNCGGTRSSLRGLPVGGVNQNNPPVKQKDSMLEKLKIFNKEKESKSKNSGGSGVSKRTSSSSGFSSARSEKSDSSTTSLCSDIRPPPLPPHQNLPGSTSSSSSDQAIGYPEQYISGKTPGLRGIRSRLSRGSKEGKESPKNSRRSEDRESSKGSPKSSHRNRGSESKEREKDNRSHVNKRAENLTLNLNTSNIRNVQMVQHDVTSRNSKLASVTSSSRQTRTQKSPSSPQSNSAQSSLQNAPCANNNTGIPKPTAAVKGTAKPTHEKMSPVSPNVNTPMAPKEYQNKMTKASISPTTSVRRPPIGCEAPAKPENRDPRDFKSSLPRQRNLGRREDGGSPSVAMVSPMPASGANPNQVSGSESGSALSEASHNSGHSNSSGGSSVIYKPNNSGDENVSDQQSKEAKAEEGDEIVDIQPMQPLIRAAQYGFIRGLGGSPHNPRVLPPSLHVSKLNLQENSHTVPLKGMKMSAAHLKNSGLSRLQQGYIINTEYSDLECIDLATGYLSDGEILRPNAACNTYPGSELDGYMSEGGASLYALRLNQRLQEGMRQVHESMNKVQHFIQDDSFDDSSSLSSGVSDTLNELSEDILSSSLSSDQTAALAHARGIKDAGLKLPVGLSGASPRKAAMGMDPSGIYKVVSSKAHVKKTDSAQQSETFKQISNTQWKKYVEPGKANFNVMEYQRSLDLSDSKKQEQKKTNVGPHSAMSHAIDGCTPAAFAPPIRRQDKKIIGREQQKGLIIPVASMQLNGDSKKIQNTKMISANFGFKKSGSSAGSGTTKIINNKATKDLNGSNGNKDGTSNSLDRPRTKLKVSGGTQTTSDLQYMPTAGFHSDGEYSSSNSLGRKYQQMKSYSLNGPAAAQLSQGVRERILQSPYRKVHMGGDINAYVGGVYYRERSPRMKVTDGSLSDSPYSNYAELQYGANPYGNSYSWVTRGNYATSVASAPARHLGGSLTEAESLESVSSSNSSFAAQLQHARATNLTQARLMMHQRDMSTSPSPRLSRSNSVRSTKSEKVLGLREGYHNSQPTSPTPPSCNRLPMSPLNTARGSPYYAPVATRTSKDDECHGSSLSLVSSSSSLYSSQEEKQAAEVRKLKRDLTDAQERVHTLTNQLTTNAHVVAAFEQSLTNMTNRLHHLSATSEQKDSELLELRRTIDSLRQQSIEAGLTVANFQSMSIENGGKVSKNKTCPSPHKHNSTSPAKASASPQTPLTKPPPHPYPPSNNASCSALNVCPTRAQPKSPEKSSTPDFARRHTFTGTCRDIVASEVHAPDGGNMIRGSSAESVSSLSSACSGTSHTSAHDKSDLSKSSKKKGWLRSSFTKAFSRGHKSKQKSSVSSDADESRDYEDISVPPSPLPIRGEAEEDQNLTDQSMNQQQDEKTDEIESLKRQLWEKDMVLTDIRLEALTSAHQLDSLKETLNKMRSEMKNLKDDNDRLQRIMVSKSLNSSRNSIPLSDHNLEHRLSVTEDIITIEDTTDVLLIDPLDKESKRVTISVFLGCHGDYEKYRNPSDGSASSECVIGAISISGKTKWDTLDSLVKRIFKEYLLRVDPASNLGINTDSIVSYHLGEISRGRNAITPELLPCGYLVGEVSNIQLVLKGAILNCVDALAIEILTSKSIMQRYISLLTEHRRIILSGSSGTGKSYLAHKMAEYLVCRLGKDPSPENIATFSVDHKTSKDLGAYLSHVSDQCESNASDLPLVIILDNLHYAGALTEVFNGFLSAKYTQCPFIIGTMIQATSCSTTNLQLHHNFRWVLMANHMEPVKGLLAKISRKKLTQVEVETFMRQPRLQQVLDWLPKCWAHINKFLETHSSSDVTIGPRLFLSCPGSVEGSQVWFTDLWNYSLVPYIVEAVREGLQLYGRRASWEDPTAWIHETYPWPNAGNKALVGLRPDDVGYDSVSSSTAGQFKSKSDAQADNDPLLSMLMRLQEAANFSSPQQDAASVSIENMENALESTL